MRECRVTQVPPEFPSIFVASDLPKQSSKCPVGSHLREVTLSCRVKGSGEEHIAWEIILFRQQRDPTGCEVGAILKTNLEDRQNYWLLIHIGLSRGQKDLSIGISHCKWLVFTVPGHTLRSYKEGRAKKRDLLDYIYIKCMYCEYFHEKHIILFEQVCNSV